jgi:hypothetical protein
MNRHLGRCKLKHPSGDGKKRLFEKFRKGAFVCMRVTPLIVRWFNGLIFAGIPWVRLHALV